MAHGREQRVAQTAAVRRVGDVAALLDVGLDRLTGAAIADAASGITVGRAQVTEVAQALTLDAERGVTGPAHDLERVARGRRLRIGVDIDLATRRGLDDRGAKCGIDARFVTEREQTADLDSRRTRRPCLAHSLGPARATREPERPAEFAHPGQVDDIARAIHRLAARIRGRVLARRRIVPAGGRALDHEAIDMAGRLARQHGREQMTRDDGEEPGAFECGRRGLGEVPRGIEAQVLDHIAPVALDLEAQLGLTPRGHGVQRARDLARDARAHQDVVDTREQCAIERRQIRHLHLGQQVHADHAVMPFLGERDFDERRQHGQPFARLRHDLLVHRHQLVRGGRSPPARDKPLAQRRGRDLGHREALHRPAQMSAQVAVLQPAHEQRVDPGARDHSQLSAP